MMAVARQEKIYEAIRRADAAGDGEAVRVLSEALRAGESREQILGRAADMNASVDEGALDANIASRDAGGATNQFVEAPSRLAQLGKSTVNTAAGLAQSAAGLYDLPLEIANYLQRKVNSLVGAAGAGAMDLVGADKAADWWRRGAKGVDETIANLPTAAGAIEAIAPTPEGMEGSRLTAQIVGGLMLPGPKGVPRPARLPKSNPARVIVDAGKREGVRVMTSDVRPPQTFVGKLTRATGERIPFAGTGGPRLKQQEERIEAVRNLAREYGVDASDDALEAVTKDLGATRGGRIKGLTAVKDRVIDGTVGVVRAPRAIASINQQIAKLRGVNEAKLAPVIRELEQFRDTLSSGKTLREIEENRRLLGEMFADPNLASVKGLGQKAINAIYDPLRSDMGAFIKANAGDAAFNAWKRANDELAAMIGELDASAFKNVLKDAETTPEKVATLLFNKRPSEVRRLYANLSPDGQERAKAAVIYEAIRKSGGLDDLSPQKLANALADFGRTTGIVFGDDAPRIQGLVRLLKATQQASVAAAAPPTGVQNSVPILAAVLTDMMGGAGAAITSGALAGAAARIYESAPVRNMLARLGKTKPGSTQERALLERIGKTLLSQVELQSGRSATNDNARLVTEIAANPQEQQ